MSLESALARVAALQAWTVQPPAPAPAPPARGPTSFHAALDQAIGTTAKPAGSYAHLTGDLDANPELLSRLDQLAAARGETWNVTSGLRTTAEQQRLWDNRHSNPYPVARPGTSRHEHGNAADVTISGRAIQDVVAQDELLRAGVAPLAGDAVHVELPA
ncbi:MAG TPA: M15 family metallopeptidase [Solirubrobacteraceae bacterium]|nr:M15 family metallopeptidase [Solirubrobacteraceae bacterium]